MVFGAFVTADIWTCHCRDSTGVNNGINNGSALVKSPTNDRVTVSQRAQHRRPESEVAKWIFSHHYLLLTPLPLLLSQCPDICKTLRLTGLLLQRGASILTKTQTQRPNKRAKVVLIYLK